MNRPLAPVVSLSQRENQIVRPVFQWVDDRGQIAHRRSAVRDSWLFHTHTGGAPIEKKKMYFAHPLFHKIWVHPNFNPFENPYSAYQKSKGKIVWRFSSLSPFTYRGTVDRNNDYTVEIDPTDDQSMTNGFLRVLIGLEIDNLELIKTKYPKLGEIVDIVLSYILMNNEKSTLLDDVKTLIDNLKALTAGQRPRTEQTRSILSYLGEQEVQHAPLTPVDAKMPSTVVPTRARQRQRQQHGIELVHIDASYPRTASTVKTQDFCVMM